MYVSLITFFRVVFIVFVCLQFGQFCLRGWYYVRMFYVFCFLVSIFFCKLFLCMDLICQVILQLMGFLRSRPPRDETGIGLSTFHPFLNPALGGTHQNDDDVDDDDKSICCTFFSQHGFMFVWQMTVSWSCWPKLLLGLTSQKRTDKQTV